jgi:hypothetical protein
MLFFVLEIQYLEQYSHYYKVGRFLVLERKEKMGCFSSIRGILYYTEFTFSNGKL